MEIVLSQILLTLLPSTERPYVAMNLMLLINMQNTELIQITNIIIKFFI